MQIQAKAASTWSVIIRGLKAPPCTPVGNVPSDPSESRHRTDLPRMKQVSLKGRSKLTTLSLLCSPGRAGCSGPRRAKSSAKESPQGGAICALVTKGFLLLLSAVVCLKTPPS